MGKILLGAGVVALALATRSQAANLSALLPRVQSMGGGAVLFVGLYAVATTVFVPAGLLTFSAGALFGVFAGAAYAFAGATLAACGSFLLSRYVAREWVERSLASRPRATALAGAVGAEGRRIVLLLRLSPIIPFAAINWSMGVSRIRFRDFAVGCVGMIPVTVLYAYFGSAASSLSAPARGADQRGWHVAAIVASVMATFAVSRIVARAATRELHRALEGAAAETAPPSRTMDMPEM